MFGSVVSCVINHVYGFLNSLDTMSYVYVQFTMKFQLQPITIAIRQAPAFFGFIILCHLGDESKSWATPVSAVQLVTLIMYISKGVYHSLFTLSFLKTGTSFL